MQIVNKKAKFNYNLFERIEAGISLLGAEAKAVRGGHVNLSDSFAKIIDCEIYLVNANIPVEGKKEYSSTRTRKRSARGTRRLARRGLTVYRARCIRMSPSPAMPSRSMMRGPVWTIPSPLPIPGGVRPAPLIPRPA